VKLLIATALVVLTVGQVRAQTTDNDDTPRTPQKSTVPHTGGFGWSSGPPQAPHNVAPAQGGSIGVQYPPDKGPTRATCSRDGVRVAC
jgi:hypothetical protein